MATKIRDPEGRKRTITQAAAALIVELGPHNITHRKVAARAGVPLGSTTQHFKTLDDLIDAAFIHMSDTFTGIADEMMRQLRDSDNLPGGLAKLLSAYLGDPEKVRVETAFFVANADNPRLRHIATQWNAGLVAQLRHYTDQVGAQAVATYVDGLTMHVIQTGQLPAEADIKTAIARLVNTGDK